MIEAICIGLICGVGVTVGLAGLLIWRVEINKTKQGYKMSTLTSEQTEILAEVFGEYDIDAIRISSKNPCSHVMIGDGILKRLHVNQHVIRRNAKRGEMEPALTCKTSSRNVKAYDIDIIGPSKLVYSPDKPLQCGAKVWLETRSAVICKTNQEVL